MVLFFRKRDFTIGQTGIDSVEKVMLGGVEQTILVQAENPTMPVLLFIHGGPCMPVPGVVSRGQDYNICITTKKLVKEFVLVFWDQRGAGKSYSKEVSPDSLRVNQYIEDAHELIDYLRDRFHQEKVFLAGHSWGTVIGLTVASQVPEKLHAYVGISQLLNWSKNDILCYDWLHRQARNAKDQKTLKKLVDLGEPPYLNSPKDWIDFRKILTAYRPMIYKSNLPDNPTMFHAFKIFLSSEDYSIRDIFHTFTSSYSLTYTLELIQDFATIQLENIEQIDIPVYFLHGEKDNHLFGQPVEKFFENLKAPLGKEMVWYEHSAHMFHPHDAKKIEDYVIRTVKRKWVDNWSVCF